MNIIIIITMVHKHGKGEFVGNSVRKCFHIPRIMATVTAGVGVSLKFVGNS